MNMPQKATKVKGEQDVLALPDITDSEKAAMTSFKHLAFTGIVRDLFMHFGEPADSVFMGERYLVERVDLPQSERRIPDLLIAFNASVALLERQNGYVISDQGKPPDFILEVGSPSTRKEDVGEKREDYARMGVGEYWRFDEDDSPNVVKLAGDRLVEGSYQPVQIDIVAEEVLEGCSEVLNLCLRWEKGQLRWYDPANLRYVPTAHSYAERANSAESRIRELEGQLRRNGIEPI
ncbi:MAG: Uma2 family endonuclease [Chloroflexota bacterium]|nr:Uma2 family endonuclease [Chloroflexota bacterium]